MSFPVSIPITNTINIPIPMPLQKTFTEYSLNQGSSVPFQNSPPNDFMSNLMRRFLDHSSFLMKDDNRNSE